MRAARRTTLAKLGLPPASAPSSASIAARNSASAPSAASPRERAAELRGPPNGSSCTKWTLRGGLEICAGCWRRPRHAVDAELAAVEARGGQRSRARAGALQSCESSSSRELAPSRRVAKPPRALPIGRRRRRQRRRRGRQRRRRRRQRQRRHGRRQRQVGQAEIRGRRGRRRRAGRRLQGAAVCADERAAGAAEGDGRQGRAAQGRRRHVRARTQAEPEPDADGDGRRAARARPSPRSSPRTCRRRSSRRRRRSTRGGRAASPTSGTRATSTRRCSA